MTEIKCMSKVWMIKEVNGQKIKTQCELFSIKHCKHGFYTCNRHYHGCKGEVRE